jgi:hypothetical protein
MLVLMEILITATRHVYFDLPFLRPIRVIDIEIGEKPQLGTDKPTFYQL